MFSAAVLLVLYSSQISFSLRESEFQSYLEASDDENSSNQCSSYPESSIQFPQDEKSHHMLEDGWYLAAHLYTEDGTYYGAEWGFTKLYTGEVPTTQSNFILYTPEKLHHVAQMLDNQLEETDGEFSLDFGDVQGYGKDGTYNFYGSVDDFELRIDVQPLKAPFIYYEDGHIDYHFGGSLHNYAYTANQISGTLKTPEGVFLVKGQGYYEHTFGKFGGILNDGWDWFNLMLDDGSEVIISMVRFNNYLWKFDENCVKTEYEFEIKVNRTWVSPHSSCQYAVEWTVTFDNKVYNLKTIYDKGEVFEKSGIRYMVPIIVSGAGNGIGFIETFGAC